MQPRLTQDQVWKNFSGAEKMHWWAGGENQQPLPDFPLFQDWGNPTVTEKTHQPWRFTATIIIELAMVDFRLPSPEFLRVWSSTLWLWLTVCYWKWPFLSIYSRFTHWKLCFSIAMLVYQRVSRAMEIHKNQPWCHPLFGAMTIKALEIKVLWNHSIFDAEKRW